MTMMADDEFIGKVKDEKKPFMKIADPIHDKIFMLNGLSSFDALKLLNSIVNLIERGHKQNGKSYTFTEFLKDINRIYNYKYDDSIEKSGNYFLFIYNHYKEIGEAIKKKSNIAAIHITNDATKEKIVSEIFKNKNIDKFTKHVLSIAAMDKFGLIENRLKEIEHNSFENQATALLSLSNGTNPYCLANCSVFSIDRLFRTYRLLADVFVNSELIYEAQIYDKEVISAVFSVPNIRH